MRHFQSKWLPAGSVNQVDDLSHRSIEQAVANALRSPQPVQIVFRSPWQHTSEQLREERRFGARARRLRDRADREEWTSSDLYTAMNNGCRIGRVTLRRNGLHPIQPIELTSEARRLFVRAMNARIGGA